jgi:hypothetical protein
MGHEILLMYMDPHVDNLAYVSLTNVHVHIVELSITC